LGSLDQGNRQSQHLAQFRLPARHATIIALVVKARQMKDPVQRQNLDLLGGTMSKPPCVLRGNFGGNRDIARRRRPLPTLHRSWQARRKREHVGGFVLTAKLAVKSTQRSTAGHQHVHSPPQPRGAPGAPHEAFKRVFAQSGDFFPQNNQISPRRRPYLGSLQVQLEKNGSYQGIASAMPSTGLNTNGFSRRGSLAQAQRPKPAPVSCPYGVSEGTP
jgi:hypothetical protein